MTSEDNSNSTKYEGSATGAFHSGSGDIQIFTSNLGEAIKVIQRIIPDETTNALEQLLFALEQLRKHQKIVNELKQIHNMLHRLETFLAILEINPDSVINIRYIEQNWRVAILPQLLLMRTFAEKGESFLEFPQLIISDKNIAGPKWITDLIVLQNDFEIGLKEQDFFYLAEISKTFLDKCREHLFLIDHQLLESINKLDEFSERILDVIKNGK